MLYCSECQVLCEEQCPLCGSRKLRAPKEDDPVFIYSAAAREAQLIEEILSGNDIPFLKAGNLGCGVTLRTGAGLETYRFYVPFGAFRKANTLLAEAFSEASKP